MAEKRYLSLSVHQLVDFLLRPGDIDDRIFNKETMQEGSKLHSILQAKQGPSYMAEYPLSGVISCDSGEIFVQGRADGIILGKEPTVEEIKTTVDELEHFYEENRQWHEGQALVYAYLYLKQNDAPGATIRLKYKSQISSKNGLLIKEKRFSKEEINAIVESFASDYFAFYEEPFLHRQARDESVASLPFPFPTFRSGQRELAKYCFGVASKGGVLLAEAPTGIGKTMSSLYPFVKSFKQGRVEKIFYLTAKGTGSIAAYKAIGQLQNAGLVARDSTLYSKEKICFRPGHRCNPDDCPFAKGYYSKLKTVLQEAMAEQKRFDFLAVSTLARKYLICPFEFQLDLSLFADIVVCDYNYFFDPIVHLERYFDSSVDQSKYLLLVDEAHNLIERGRSMYSASLSSSSVESARFSLKGKNKKGLSNALSKLHQALLDLPIDEGETVLQSNPEDVLTALTSLKGAEQTRTKKTSSNSELGPRYKDLSREAGRYLRLSSDFKSPSVIYYAEKREGEIRLNLCCLDASSFLSDSLSKVKGAALFSATLSPISYFAHAILGKEDTPYLLLPSPFSESNFHLMIAPKISVRYKDREKSYPEVAKYLKKFVEARMGNYFLYFPSYEYLEKIRPHLDFECASVLVQDKKMSEEEKTVFLESFSPNPTFTTVGLLILGGAFSEGVDLISDRLIGVGIVGVGMPQINFENNLLRSYYQKKESDGFSYAYQNPGMNKIMQALGRVIRSESDVGAALLIDDRYAKNEYRSLLLRGHPSYQIVTSEEEVEESLSSFYLGKGLK